MEPQMLISLGALVISTGAFLLSRKSFFESNRPIVIAEIMTHDAGNTATMFSLAIHNVGNRPACEIRLTAKDCDLEKAVNKGAEQKRTKDIYNCFSEEGVIPVLPPGKSTKNSFGASSIIDLQNVLIYQSKLPIVITYKDLSRTKYKSKITLIVKDSEAFAGSSWSEREQNA